ncbi:MAG: hypothetical protein AB7U76_25090 [Pirellulales bacterium]
MLRLIILAAAILAPFATYAGMRVREHIVVGAAVEGERKAGLARCKADILALEAKHNAQVDEAAREAESAADTVDEAKTDAEIADLCKRSASCRDRGKL